MTLPFPFSDCHTSFFHTRSSSTLLSSLLSWFIPVFFFFLFFLYSSLSCLNLFFIKVLSRNCSLWFLPSFYLLYLLSFSFYVFLLSSSLFLNLRPPPFVLSPSFSLSISISYLILSWLNPSLFIVPNWTWSDSLCPLPFLFNLFLLLTVSFFRCLPPPSSPLLFAYVYLSLLWLSLTTIPSSQLNLIWLMSPLSSCCACSKFFVDRITHFLSTPLQPPRPYPTLTTIKQHWRSSTTSVNDDSNASGQVNMPSCWGGNQLYLSLGSLPIQTILLFLPPPLSPFDQN